MTSTDDELHALTNTVHASFAEAADAEELDGGDMWLILRAVILRLQHGGLSNVTIRNGLTTPSPDERKIK